MLYHQTITALGRAGVARRPVRPARGEGKLVQGDPLPQTIYRVKTKAGGYVVVNLPLLIAP